MQDLSVIFKQETLKTCLVTSESHMTYLKRSKLGSQVDALHHPPNTTADHPVMTIALPHVGGSCDRIRHSAALQECQRKMTNSSECPIWPPNFSVQSSICGMSSNKSNLKKSHRGLEESPCLKEVQVVCNSVMLHPLECQHQEHSTPPVSGFTVLAGWCMH